MGTVVWGKASLKRPERCQWPTASATARAAPGVGRSALPFRCGKPVAFRVIFSPQTGSVSVTGHLKLRSRDR
jgi:hypothetical protein